MFDATSTVSVLNSSFSHVGIILAIILPTLVTSLVALYGLGFSIEKLKLWIYNGGLGRNEFVRNFGTPPWRGYNRWRSPKWNQDKMLNS